MRRSAAPKKKEPTEDVAAILKKYKNMEVENEEFEADEEAIGIQEKFVDSVRFNLFIAVMICLNALSVGLEIDHGNVDVPISERLGWYLVECVFCLIFTLELFLRLSTYKKEYFYDPWNWFDFVLIIAGILETWVLSIMNSTHNLRMLSTLRVIRLVRLGRLVRLLRMFKELWLIVNGLVDSFKTLGWVSLLLVLLLYVCAIFTTIQVGQNDAVYDSYRVQSGGWDHKEYFGTVFKSMYTLFQVITLESWADGIARHVITNEPPMAVFFIVFIMLTSYGLLNLVVGVIVENTLATAKHNEARIRRKQERERHRVLTHLKEIFAVADKDKSGSLTIEEFRVAIRTPEIESKLKLIEIPVADAEELFMVLDHDGSGELNVDEFIGGCVRLKGVAKSKDLLAVQISVESLARKMDHLESQLEHSESKISLLDSKTKKMLKEALEFFNAEGEVLSPVHQSMSPSAAATLREQGTNQRKPPSMPPFPELS